ncbi:MAG: hypothetical protein MUE54_11660 [Anaerolineae bacterium]|jgi:hypothetical protein|nr:hypothetical protein [Anaerolineae bacterium]
MPIELLWDNDHRSILRYDIGGAWAWEELHVAREKVFVMMDEAPSHKIGTIIHFVEGKIGIPGDVTKHLSRFGDKSHPKAALTVIVGAGMMMKLAFGGFQSAFRVTTGKKVDFDYADTLDQARKKVLADLNRK